MDTDLTTVLPLDPDAPVACLDPSRIRPNFGIFHSEPEVLDGLVQRLVAALDPAEIWLFGSRARGDAAPDSDFDLLVVAKPDGRFGSEDYVMVDRPIRDTRVGCDLVPCSAEDFAQAKIERTTLVAQALAYGRCLFRVAG
jgi:predicted nucleotidyltransferase